LWVRGITESPVSSFVCTQPAFPRRRDILLLALLRAAAKQNHKPIAISGEVDSIAGAEGDLVFKNPPDPVRTNTKPKLPNEPNSIPLFQHLRNRPPISKAFQVACCYEMLHETLNAASRLSPSPQSAPAGRGPWTNPNQNYRTNPTPSFVFNERGKCLPISAGLQRA
jgi:hypothetical protein